jgi:hypothetical protein
MGGWRKPRTCEPTTDIQCTNGQEATSSAYALLLAAREPGPALAHVGVVAVGQGRDKLVGVGEPRCRLDFLVRHRPAVRDAVRNVVPDGGREQIRLLRVHVKRGKGVRH